jgi:hypothetical protein
VSEHEEGEGVIEFDGLEEAIVGTCTAWDTSGNRPERLVYSGEKIAEIFMERDGMTREDALEFISVNTEGGYLGPNTPIVIWPFERDEDAA